MTLSPSNHDQIEIDKFDQSNTHWWDTEGPLKTLHVINPARMSFIENNIELKGKSVCDVGCGGGILTESLARSASKVTGIDLNQSAIEVARDHSRQNKFTNIEYLQTDSESFAKQGAGEYDIVTCMELLEHVPDRCSLIKACSELLRPGGMIFFATLNRTAACYVKAVLMAEHVMKLLPQGTHDYSKFIRPSELAQMCRESNLTVYAMSGLSYIPFIDQARLSSNMDTNYLLAAVKS